MMIFAKDGRTRISAARSINFLSHENLRLLEIVPITMNDFVKLINPPSSNDLLEPHIFGDVAFLCFNEICFAPNYAYRIDQKPELKKNEALFALKTYWQEEFNIYIDESVEQIQRRIS